MALVLTRKPPPMLTFDTSPGASFSLSVVNGEEDAAAGMVMEPGSRLEVLKGSVELQFASGVRALVRGPADLTLHREDLLHLTRGAGWFEVPPKVVGFQVNTPGLNLTDLGTEFGILSRPGFLDEVHVFDGKVEVLNRYGLKRKETIIGGQARVAGPAGRWQETPLLRDHFLTTLPTTGSGDFDQALFYDDFQNDSSADYICSDYYRGGEHPDRFRINGSARGVLELATGELGQHGAQVVHRSARLEAGQAFRVDWLTPALTGYSISQVLSDSTDGIRYAVRLRVNDGAYTIDFARNHTGKVRWANRSPYAVPETFWVERRNATEFTWYRGSADTGLVKIADISFDSDPGPLLVGVQTWATTAQFDDFAIVPSPATVQPQAPEE